jgi:hypothetical protein
MLTCPLIAQFRVAELGVIPGFDPVVTISIWSCNLVGLCLARVLVVGLIDKSAMLGCYLAAVVFALVEPALILIRLLVVSFTERRGEMVAESEKFQSRRRQR